MHKNVDASSLHRVHHVGAEGVLVGSRRGEVFQGPPDALEYRGCFPAEWGDVLPPCALISRVLRADRCVVHPMEGTSLLGIRGGVVGAFRARRWHPLGKVSGRAPLHSRLARDSEGWVYVPEWWANRARSEVRLWRVDPDATRMEVAHTWSPGLIRHLHTVVEDPHEAGVLWASSGDLDGECYLWRSADRFRTVERWGDGSQAFRAVFMWFTSDRIGWLTDTEKTINRVQWMDRSTGDLHTGQALPGPVWHGTALQEHGWVATTTVEVGPGVTHRRACILFSGNGEDWAVCAEWEKDGWRPHGLFGHGLIQLPAGQMSGRQVWMDASGLVERSGVFSMDLHGFMDGSG
jgi:hypothetical protein